MTPILSKTAPAPFVLTRMGPLEIHEVRVKSSRSDVLRRAVVIVRIDGGVPLMRFAGGVSYSRPVASLLVKSGERLWVHVELVPAESWWERAVGLVLDLVLPPEVRIEIIGAPADYLDGGIEA